MKADSRRESVMLKKPAPRESRRRFVERAAYVAPAIVTLAAFPSFAKAGSDKKPKPKVK